MMINHHPGGNRLFGVREETLKRSGSWNSSMHRAQNWTGRTSPRDKVDCPGGKYARGYARSALFSPFPFHSVYSVEDHKKHVDWIKETNTRALVSVKVSTPTDVDMVAVGSYYAGAHIVQLDGSYGGTGAALI